MHVFPALLEKGPFSDKLEVYSIVRMFIDIDDVVYTYRGKISQIINARYISYTYVK